MDGQLMAITDGPSGHPMGSPPGGQAGFAVGQSPPLPPPPCPPGGLSPGVPGPPGTSPPVPAPAVDGDYTSQWLQEMESGGDVGRGKDASSSAEWPFEETMGGRDRGQDGSTLQGALRPPIARESRHDAPVLVRPPDSEFKSLLQEAMDMMDMGASSGSGNRDQPPPQPQPDAGGGDDFTSQWLNAMDNWDDEAWDVANSKVAELVPPPPPDEAPPLPAPQPLPPQHSSGLPPPGPLGAIAAGAALGSSLGSPLMGAPLLSAPMSDQWTCSWTPCINRPRCSVKKVSNSQMELQAERNAKDMTRRESGGEGCVSCRM